MRSKYKGAFYTREFSQICQSFYLKQNYKDYYLVIDLYPKGNLVIDRGCIIKKVLKPSIFT